MIIKSEGKYWISLFIDKNTAVCSESFGIEDIPKEVLNKFRDNQILTIYLEYKIMNVLCMNFIGLLS